MKNKRNGLTRILTFLLMISFFTSSFTGISSAQTSSQVIRNAQDIYLHLVKDYGSVEAYCNTIASSKEYALRTVNQAGFYEQAYDYVVDYSTAGLSVAVGALTGSPTKALKSFGDTAFGMFTDEISKEIPKLTLSEFVYSQAISGANLMGISELMNLGFEIRDNHNGIIPNVEMAVNFIRAYKSIEIGFASLVMGKNYYFEKLNQPVWNTLFDIGINFASGIIGDKIGGMVIDKYAYGKTINSFFDMINLLSAQINNPYVTTWTQNLIRISKETEALIVINSDDILTPQSTNPVLPTQPATTVPQQSNVNYTANVMDKPNVWFNGGYAYKSASGNGRSQVENAAGWVTVTFQTMDKSAPYPYHVIHQDGSSKVYGWVAENTLNFQKNEATVATTPDPILTTVVDIHVDKILPELPVSANMTEWTLASLLPENTNVTGIKWGYDLTQTVSSLEPSLEGWTQIGSEWRLSGAGAREWSNFPGGFLTEHVIYNSYDKGPVQGYENSQTKRVVSNGLSRYIYWHWVAKEDNGSYDRFISDYKGTDSGTTFNYFHALEGSNSYEYWPTLGAYLWNAGPYSSYWWFRLDLMKSTYEDYTKVYKYSRTTRTESTTYPEEANIANVQMYVQYALPKRELELYIGYPLMSTPSGWKSIDENGTSPIVKNGRTLIPIRAIVEEMGGKVEWDAKSDPNWSKVTCTVNGKKIELWIGYDQFFVDGKEYIFDVPPTIIGGRTMIPTSAIFQAIGCKVSWEKNGGGIGWDLVKIEY